MRYLLIISTALVILAGCKKKDKDLPHSPVPSIEILSVSPGTVTENVDSIIFEIAYLDGDGDLGENDPNAKNLFIIDNRINLAEEFRIPQLAPDGANIAISGTLRVELPGTVITNGSTSQGATFTVYMRDRAGHESEKVVSSEITVTK